MDTKELRVLHATKLVFLLLFIIEYCIALHTKDTRRLLRKTCIIHLLKKNFRSFFGGSSSELLG